MAPQINRNPRRNPTLINHNGTEQNLRRHHGTEKITWRQIPKPKIDFGVLKPRRADRAINAPCRANITKQCILKSALQTNNVVNMTS